MARNVEIEARVASLDALRAVAEAHAPMSRLGVDAASLVPGAYLDLLRGPGG